MSFSHLSQEITEYERSKCVCEGYKSKSVPEGALLASKRDYLSSVYQKIYLGDIAARHSIENTFALKLMFKKIAESVMQPMSFSRLANIVTAAGVKVGKSTVINYAEYAKDALLITPVSNFA